MNVSLFLFTAFKLKNFFTGIGSLTQIFIFSCLTIPPKYGTKVDLVYHYLTVLSFCLRLFSMLYFRFRHLMLRSSYIGNGIRRHEQRDEILGAAYPGSIQHSVSDVGNPEHQISESIPRVLGDVQHLGRVSGLRRGHQNVIT